MSRLATGARKHLQFRSRILVTPAPPTPRLFIYFFPDHPVWLVPLSPHSLLCFRDRCTIADALRRSRQIYCARFNLASADHAIIADVGPAVAPVVVGPVFASSFRNYIKSVFQKGYMYTLSCQPRTFFYVAENKTLAGREDRDRAGDRQQTFDQHQRSATGKVLSFL